MGFFSSISKKIFGGTSRRRNPYRDMSVQMPAAMDAYFKDIRRQMRQAELAGKRLRAQQTSLFTASWNKRSQALDQRIANVKNRKSALGPVLKKVEAGAISRGLGMTTAPDTKKFALSAQEEMGRQRELENLKFQRTALTADRYAALSKLRESHAKQVFDPTAFLDFEIKRIGMQPWGEMGRPISYQVPGMFGGAGGQLLGAVGGGAIAGLI